MIDRNYIETQAEKLSSKLKNIKLCLLDVDGVLTNGDIYYSGEEMGFNRSTNALDGHGIKLLMRAGIKVGIITGGDSLSVVKRFQENLKCDYCYMGNEDKLDAYEDVKAIEGVSDSEILYMGDELFDLPLLKRAGFAATVPNAAYEIFENVDYITKREGGTGAVREVIDILRFVQGIAHDG
jgi:3-deoxy-D-manno-octulosonate 8-phosphate phosphatase (KDO 8-P phosphatase)